MVKIISQELRTSATTMPVIDSEIRAFRPVFVLSMFRFNNIQNNRDSVFIVISNQSLVGISGIGSYDSVSLKTAFSLLIIRDYNPLSWLNL
jgi:hypothetical protein